MSIVLNPYSRPDEWMAEFGRLLPDETVRLWPDVGDPEQVELVIAWIMPRSALQSYPNLKAVLSLGAGAEQWQKEGMPDVPVVRLVDPAMSDEMATYALAWVIRLQRGFDVCEEQQAIGVWADVDYTQAWKTRIGILGYGNIGARVGEAFLDLGYQVNAWSRSGGGDSKATHYVGLDELDAFLSSSDAVVNVLPSTEETTDLLDGSRFSQMPEGSIVVNMGRGTVLVDDDLIKALDDGPLAAAVLDVTRIEPTPEDSPFWSHPQVILTPHVAGSTQVRSASELVAANIQRIRSGESPFPLLDRRRGY
jgi:glyoxylate/hydroxypyruvate reductase A